MVKKSGDKKKDKPKWLLEIIYLRIDKVWCPNLICQSKEVVFIMENEIKGKEVSHS
jgi:hypothetical protein